MGYSLKQHQARVTSLGANPQIARRCGIAIYEAEMNLIIHTLHGGTLRMKLNL